MVALGAGSASGTPGKHVIRIGAPVGLLPMPVRSRPMPANMRPPVGWRDERRRRAFKKISYRQRRNAKLAKV